MKVEFTAYIWQKLDKHISLYIPDVGVAIACLYCEDATSTELIAKAVNNYLTAAHSDMFTKEQEIKFPQRYHSVSDDGVILASFASEDDAYEFYRRHDGAKTE